jgi:hypothetical protein
MEENTPMAYSTRLRSRLPVVGLLAALVAGNAANLPAHAQGQRQGTTLSLQLVYTGAQWIVPPVTDAPNHPSIGQGRIQISGGLTVTGTYSFGALGHATAANGCTVSTMDGSVVLSTLGDSFDTVSVMMICPVAGAPGRSTAVGTMMVTQGTGRFKGAIGTFALTANFRVLPRTAVQPFTRSSIVTDKGTLTLASQ